MKIKKIKNIKYKKYFKEKVLKYFEIFMKFLNISKWNISSCISSRPTMAWQYCLSPDIVGDQTSVFLRPGHEYINELGRD